MQAVIDTIKKYVMLPQGARVLCGFSGGADSCALLHFLNKNKSLFKIEVAAAHLNHMIRGSEAERDEKFCASFCEHDNIPFYSEKADIPTLAKEASQSIELCARNRRYAFFAETASRNGFERIATAHNADDNAETVIFNLVRGTGIDGLCGIPPVRNNIIRPLIETPRAEIEEYLFKNGVSFVTDSSNFENEYTRNKIRHFVMPALREINPDFLSSVSTASHMLRQDSAFISSSLPQPSDKASVLRGLHPAISSRVLRDMYGGAGGERRNLSSRNIADILDACSDSNGSVSVDLPDGIVFTRAYDRVNFCEKQKKADSGFLRGILAVPGKTRLNENLEAETFFCDRNVFNNLLNTFAVNYDKITDNIIIRPAEPGDLFRRNAKSGEKKLSRIFSDMKIPLAMRPGIPVFADGSGRVIAVSQIGVNYDFAPSDGCRILCIKLTE